MEHKEWYTDKIIKLRKINFYFYFLNYVIVCSVCCANLLQLCLTLRDAMDYSPPGSSAHGFSQARILERVAISSSRWSSWLTMNLLFLHLLHWQVILYHLGSPRAPISSVQSLSLVQLFATPWTAAHQASLSITNSQSLLKLMSIESVMPSNHLILCRPLFLLPSIFPSIRDFSNESALGIRWPKYWSSSFSISLPSEYSGLISFRVGWLDVRAIEGILKSLFPPTPQFKSISVQFFSTQLSL